VTEHASKRQTCLADKLVGLTTRLKDFMHADEWPGAAAFCREHIDREPALQCSARFADPTWLLRVVLLEEWMECLFALSHIDLARAKLAWWADEADLAKAGAPRHPVLIELQKSGQRIEPIKQTTRAALAWLDLPTATDSATQAAQWDGFVSGAALLFDDRNSEPLWRTLVAKRQLQMHGLSERYGPSWASRADLAQYQVKTNQLGNKQICRTLLTTRLQQIHAEFKRVASESRLLSCASRIFAALHAVETKHWLQDQTMAFFPRRIGPTALLLAWWKSL
jgi:hypothetical protein